MIYAMKLKIQIFFQMYNDSVKISRGPAENAGPSIDLLLPIT
jgi:hypothetical protein